MTNIHYFWALVVVAIIVALAFGPAVVIAFGLIILGMLGIYLAGAYLMTYGAPGWLIIAAALLMVAFAIGVIGDFYSRLRVNAVGDLEAHRVRVRDGDEQPNRAKQIILALLKAIDL